MRTRGRTLAALGVLAALVALCGCTVQTLGADGRPLGGGPVSAGNTGVPLRPGDTGSAVRELQARLRQLDWLFDGPTGSYDDLTERAVRGFQGKRGLPVTGVTDAATWRRLVA
ncbi:murein L,D-transpeptidase [Streptomyces rochei]|nr:murein L,D-transpeptidase [Streptomyces rochei]